MEICNAENMKIVFLDLDLTLLNSKQEITDYTVEVLNKCREKGLLIAFATSRGISRSQKYIDQVHPEIVISNAGADITYKNQLIHQEEFSLEETRALLKETYNCVGENAEITVDTVNGIYWNRKEDKSTGYFPDAIYDDCRCFPEPAMKFCVQTTDESKAKQIAATVQNCTFILFSDIPWYKFAPSTATKENGIKFISEYLNISFEEMVAFGDDFSDIEMIKLCGKGVAMGNAIPQVKEICDDVTLSCDEDGVACWLEKNFLKFK